MIPEKVQQWLREHGKGDLHECTWAELSECFAYAGIHSSLVGGALARQEKEQNLWASWEIVRLAKGAKEVAKR